MTCQNIPAFLYIIVINQNDEDLAIEEIEIKNVKVKCIFKYFKVYM